MPSSTADAAEVTRSMDTPPTAVEPVETHDERLALLPIDRAAWRLCDRRERESDAAYVVAYLERDGDGYDVIWMRSDRPRERFATIGEIITMGSALLDAAVSGGPVRPHPIAHFPPVAWRGAARQT